ncbi:MAG: alkyl hydroperoxide reductase/Thiol specific antioxidant/Mal allergen [Crocinitomicaceae bacterium]|jgi:thiol-disulfide isomerase/thioredoxin|nr:alkyl hydroperoxide reductase/Thiol specific antioxidant/Mal allergen [Crocinitomicaceae bacterium]
MRVIALAALVAFWLLGSFALVPAVGEKAPDIELINKEGKKVKLSSLKGKLVLIDFWASWCGPCRKENPNVVEAYNKYRKAKFKNAKGFEVFSVSLDRTEEPWKKAIETDKLSWKNHVWDKDGIASKMYSVYSIPSAFLVDGKGMIVAAGTSLRGLGLHVEIEKQLKPASKKK